MSNGVKYTATEIREMFFAGNKQMEFFKFILSTAELQSLKPEVLMTLVCFRLSLSKGDFKPDSFRKWLSRYRKKNSNKTIVTSSTGKNSDGAPRPKFQFTDPSTVKRVDEPLITFVK